MIFNFINLYIFPNISVTDLFITFTSATHILARPKIDKSISLFWIYAPCLIAGFGALSITSEYASFPTYALTLLRYAAYALFAYVFAFQLTHTPDRVARNLILGLRFCSILVAVELVGQVFGFYYSYYIPGLTIETSPQVGPFRPSALFNEPSYLAIYAVVSFFLLDAINGRNSPTSYRLYAGFLCVASLSLAGMVLFLTSVLLNVRMRAATYRGLRDYLPYFVFLLFLLWALGDRIADVLRLEDGSANHRLFGATEIFMFVLNTDPLSGAGLGQVKFWMQDLQHAWQAHFFMEGYSKNSGVNNGVLRLLLDGGVGLLVSYFVLGFLLLERNALLFYVAILFAWGYYFHPLALMVISYGMVSSNRK